MSLKKQVILICHTLFNLVLLCFYFYLSKESFATKGLEGYYGLIFAVGIFSFICAIILEYVILKKIDECKEKTNNKYLILFFGGYLVLIGCNVFVYVISC